MDSVPYLRAVKWTVGMADEFKPEFDGGDVRIVDEFPDRAPIMLSEMSEHQAAGKPRRRHGKRSHHRNHTSL